MRKFDISASLYVGLDEYPLEDNISYLKLLYDVGVRRIFISAHMPEAHSDALAELNILIDKAQTLNMEVIVDVNKNALKKIGIINNIYSLRLDWGFDFEDIIELTKYDFLIELNASVVKKELLDKLIERKIGLSKFRVSHNFYPKPYTGLSQDDLIAKNKLFHEYGFKVMAYLPSMAGKRPPLKEGLPTIEEHRNLDVLASLSEFALLGVDEVCFGDAYCKMEEIKAALNFDKEILEIPINIYEGISEVELDILSKVHRNRQDASKFLIRSSYRSKDEIPSFSTINRNKFMVTIDNKDFMRYQGEVGIIIKNLPSDVRVNVVGEALITNYLLKAIKPGQKFKFKIRGKIPWKK